MIKAVFQKTTLWLLFAGVKPNFRQILDKISSIIAQNAKPDDLLMNILGVTPYFK